MAIVEIFSNWRYNRFKLVAPMGNKIDCLDSNGIVELVKKCYDRELQKTAVIKHRITAVDGKRGGVDLHKHSTAILAFAKRNKKPSN